MQNALYLFGAFGLSWAIIFLYIYSLDKRQKKIEVQLNKIKVFFEKIQAG